MSLEIIHILIPLDVNTYPHVSSCLLRQYPPGSLKKKKKSTPPHLTTSGPAVLVLYTHPCHENCWSNTPLASTLPEPPCQCKKRSRFQGILRTSRSLHILCINTYIYTSLPRTFSVLLSPSHAGIFLLPSVLTFSSPCA